METDEDVKIILYVLAESVAARLRENGVEYEISKVKDIRRAASLKAGGAGMRYTCVVDGKEVYLFYEDNNMWFMEKSA